MSNELLPNYLYKYRDQASLTQEDVAALMTDTKHTDINRHEHFTKDPDAEMLLIYEGIYDVPITKLFAGKYLDVRLQLADRADQRREEIETGSVNQIDFDQRLETLGRIRDLSGLELR